MTEVTTQEVTQPRPSGILIEGMSANANPLPTAPASRNVREFLAVCARHNVPHGDLNCLPTLLRELKANKHFAMHFWSVVAGMMDKQAADTQTILGALVEAVTGRTVDEARNAGPAQRILLDRLERLLVGLDIETEDISKGTPRMEAAPDLAASSVSVAPTGLDTDSTSVSDQQEEQVLPIRRVSSNRRGRRLRRVAVEPEPVAHVTSAPIRDNSPRLVLMSELEPASAPAASTRPVAAASARPARVSVIPEEASRSAAVPLSSYAETAPRRTLAAGPAITLLVILFLAGAGYVISRHGGAEMFARFGTAIRTGYNSAVAAWHGEPAQTPAAIVVTSTPVSQPVSMPAQVTPHAAAQATSQPPTSSPVSTTPAPAPPSRSKPAPAGELTPAQRMAVIAAMNSQGEPIPDETGGTPVTVPEAAMNAHLIISRVPVVPDDVREKGITGVVRMQALINRYGFVSRLHVLQGPTELRHPALAAVSAWRYRPYLAKGQPVDVATTITVDFSSLN